MAVELTRRRFTVAEYHRMAAAGILGQDDRVELIEGEIIQMSPIGPDHAGCVDFLANVLRQGIGADAIIRCQNPIVLDGHTEPEPDLAVVPFRADYYRGGHPTPTDVLLIVEVAESSLEYDRQVKIALYARNGIPEAWLVNLPQRLVLIYRDPGPGGYRTVVPARSGETIGSPTFPGLSLAVADILG